MSATTDERPRCACGTILRAGNTSAKCSPCEDAEIKAKVDASIENARRPNLRLLDEDVSREVRRAAIEAAGVSPIPPPVRPSPAPVLGGVKWCRKGCKREATRNVGGRGSFATLCEECYEAAREHMRSAARNQHAEARPLPAVRRPGPAPGTRTSGGRVPARLEGSREQLARELAEVAAELDGIEAAHASLRARERPVVERYSELVRALADHPGAS